MTENEPLSSLTHFVGLLLSIVVLVLMIIYSATSATAWHIVGFSIFGASLILLYGASALYHFVPASHKAKRILQKIDHSMIYLLIAGTYTPMTFVVLDGGWRWGIFGVVWGLALLGITLTLVTRKVRSSISLTLYLGMGWLGIITFPTLYEQLGNGILWLFLGGVLYTSGVLFYILHEVLPRTRWMSMHDVFHIFVLAGSASHVWLMLGYVMYI